MKADIPSSTSWYMGRLARRWSRGSLNVVRRPILAVQIDRAQGEVLTKNTREVKDGKVEGRVTGKRMWFL
jgi:hypothetical protein